MTMMPAGAGGEPFRVFLKHLFMSTTESQLRGELSKLDADEGLQQVHLVKRGRFDNTRTINGFLTYNTKAQVDKAVDLLQGQMLGGLCKYPAEVDQAYPRNITGRYYDANVGAAFTVGSGPPQPSTAAPTPPPMPRPTPPVTLRPTMYQFPPIPPMGTQFMPPCPAPPPFQMPAAWVKVEGTTAKAQAKGGPEPTIPAESKATNPVIIKNHPVEAPAHPVQPKGSESSSSVPEPTSKEYREKLSQAISKENWDEEDLLFLLPPVQPPDDYEPPVQPPDDYADVYEEEAKEEKTEQSEELVQEKVELEEFFASAAFGSSTAADSVPEHTSPTSPASEGHLEAAKQTKVELPRRSQHASSPRASSSSSAYSASYSVDQSRSRSRRRHRQKGRRGRHQRGRKPSKRGRDRKRR